MLNANSASVSFLTLTSIRLLTTHPAVKPDATQEEVNTVVNDSSGGGDQVFAQAVSTNETPLFEIPIRSSRHSYRTPLDMQNHDLLIVKFKTDMQIFSA